MFRKDLIERLLMRPLSIQQIARLLEERPRDVEDDLHHLLRSLKKSPYRAVVTPDRCRKCDFRFHDDKLHKPGKCPRCHESWICEPLDRDTGTRRRKELKGARRRQHPTRTYKPIL